jgi:hypothetical protein
MSDRRAKTSPVNGAMSRGPVTLAGKQASSVNARSHGILSRELLLPSEDPAEYRQLLGELTLELRPSGTLEHALVERIAIAMWRQRRLVRAENARVLKLQLQATALPWQKSPDVSSERRSLHEVTGLLEELAIIIVNPQLRNLPVSEFVERYPRAFVLLQETEGSPDPTLIEPNEADPPISEYYQNLIGWAQGQHRQWVEKQAAILRRDAVCMPAESDKIARYQSALDNELYKAMRALRQAQDWRRETLESDG